MSQYVASLIDHGTLIVIVGWIAFHFHLSKKITDAKRKKWVPILCSVVVAFNVVGLMVDLTQDSPQGPQSTEKLQSREEIRALLRTEGKTTAGDSVLSLRNGSKITVPGGYRYTTPTQGAIRLFAIGQNEEILFLVRAGNSSDLKAFESSERAKAKASNQGLELGPSRAEKINGCDALVLDLTYSNSTAQGYLVLVTSGSGAYELSIVAPWVIIRAKQSEFLRVVHSLTAGL